VREVTRYVVFIGREDKVEDFMKFIQKPNIVVLRKVITAAVEPSKMSEVLVDLVKAIYEHYLSGDIIYLVLHQADPALTALLAAALETLNVNAVIFRYNPDKGTYEDYPLTMGLASAIAVLRGK